MFCKECGFENNKIVKFCIECGSPIEENEEDWSYSSDDFSDNRAITSDYRGREIYSDNRAITSDYRGKDTYSDNLSVEADYRAMESSIENHTPSDIASAQSDYEGLKSRNPYSYYPAAPYSGGLPSGNDPKLIHLAKGGWNWGAFTFNWIWLLANNMVPWGIGLFLLNFISGLGFFVSIYLGLKGNELAWTYRPFRNLQHFEETQKSWNFWGLVLFFGSLGFFMLFFFLMIFLGV